MAIPVRKYDAVVVGAGGSGLRAALQLSNAGLKVSPDWNRGKIMDELVSTFVEPRLIQPTFLVDYPLEFPGSISRGRDGRGFGRWHTYPPQLQRRERYSSIGPRVPVRRGAFGRARFGGHHKRGGSGGHPG